MPGTNSVYDQVMSWIDRRFRRVALAIEFVVIVLWILSAIIPWLRSAILGGSFFNVVIVFLVVDILRRVVQLQLNQQGEADVTVAKTQGDASQAILKELDAIHPRKADLIVYSGASMRSVLMRLKEAGASVRILVSDPTTPVNPAQKARIEYGIQCISDEIFARYQNVEVRCYQSPASLRGMNIDGKLVSVGWYTYEDDKLEVHGEDNPVLIARTITTEGARLESFFQDAFKHLWEHSRTRPLAEVGVAR